MGKFEGKVAIVTGGGSRHRRGHLEGARRRGRLGRRHRHQARRGPARRRRDRRRPAERPRLRRQHVGRRRQREDRRIRPADLRRPAPRRQQRRHRRRPRQRSATTTSPRGTASSASTSTASSTASRYQLPAIVAAGGGAIVNMASRARLGRHRPERRLRRLEARARSASPRSPPSSTPPQGVRTNAVGPGLHRHPARPLVALRRGAHGARGAARHRPPRHRRRGRRAHAVPAERRRLVHHRVVPPRRRRLLRALVRGRQGAAGCRECAEAAAGRKCPDRGRAGFETPKCALSAAFGSVPPDPAVRPRECTKTAPGAPASGGFRAFGRARRRFQPRFSASPPCWTCPRCAGTDRRRQRARARRRRQPGARSGVAPRARSRGHRRRPRRDRHRRPLACARERLRRDRARHHASRNERLQRLPRPPRRRRLDAR